MCTYPSFNLRCEEIKIIKLLILPINFPEQVSDVPVPIIFKESTQFGDVNVDCILLVLKKLDLPSLLNIARVNKGLSYLAGEVFHRRYLKYQIEIDRNSFSNNSNEIFFDYSGRIRLQSYETMLNMLKHFGNSISTLKIDFVSMNSKQSKFISKLINENCSDRLRHLTLDCCKAHTLRHMSKPYKNVESISFLEQLHDSRNETLSLNKLFPRMRKLSFNFISTLDGNYINCDLPQLIDLSVDVSDYGNTQNEDDIGQLIKRNPNIRSLTLGYTTAELLNVASNTLRHLETLTLCASFKASKGAVNSNFYLENVKTFIIKNNACPINFKFHFTQLEELRLACMEKNCDAWINLFENHNNLRRLYIHEGTINDSQFARLTVDQTDLIETSIECQANIRAETIVRFMWNSDKLIRFHMSLATKIMKKILKQTLSNSWKIIDIGRGISFERKIVK